MEAGMADAAIPRSPRLHVLARWTLVLALCGAAAWFGLRRADARPGANPPLKVAKLHDPARLEGRITAWGWNIAAKSLRGLTPAFQQRYPRVHVDVEMAGATAQTRFLLSLASGTG